MRRLPTHMRQVHPLSRNRLCSHIFLRTHTHTTHHTHTHVSTHHPLPSTRGTGTCRGAWGASELRPVSGTPDDSLYRGVRKGARVTSKRARTQNHYLSSLSYTSSTRSLTHSCIFISMRTTTTQHAWNGYVQRAWGANEVRPVSGTPDDSLYRGVRKGARVTSTRAPTHTSLVISPAHTQLHPLIRNCNCARVYA